MFVVHGGREETTLCGANLTKGLQHGLIFSIINCLTLLGLGDIKQSVVYFLGD